MDLCYTKEIALQPRGKAGGGGGGEMLEDVDREGLALVDPNCQNTKKA